MGFEEFEKLGYKQLKDLSFDVDTKNMSFVLCFWVYLPKNTPFPCTLLHQLHSCKPFLGLREDKRLTLSPSFLSREEVTDLTKAVPCIISEVEFPLEQWVHLGCEVGSNFMRIHLDRKVVGEQLLNSSQAKEDDLQSSTLKFTSMREGFEALDGYVYNAEALPSTSSVESHCVKDPPVQLSVDCASVSDIEAESDGTWNILGGKVSCRKTFSLDILLLDAFGQPVDNDLKVVASLIYADDQSPVAKSEDDGAPLLAICDGLEFSSVDKPSRLVQGRASFRMKIPQLSSMCNNKLFSIKFSVLEMEDQPFLEAFTPPIRCISRTCNSMTSSITWKKLKSGVHLFNGSSSPQYGIGHSEFQQKVTCEVRPNPPPKRVRFEQDNSVQVTKVDSSVKQSDDDCSSYSVPENKVQSAVGTSLETIQENYGGLDTSSSDTESTESGNSELKNVPSREELLSDLKIFRYCLAGLSERSAMLKEIAVFVPEQDVAEMAEKVSFFSGCTHHRHQIMMTKGLLDEGVKVWKLISRDNHGVQWDDAVFEIEEHFMRISCCSTRALSQQDLNFLRRMSGGHEYMTKDDFDKMWNWLFPVAFTISRQEINALWASTSPKWIEGFVTKEEVEFALQSPAQISEPGTFILRFPTTRSWPHPDAGSLVASYVGRDYSLHHRQLSLDYSSGIFGTNSKPLQELLLSEPELSRVGGITINNLTI